VLQELVDGHALVRLLDEHISHEVAELGRPFLFIEAEGRLVRDVVQDSHLLFVDEGGFADDHLNDEDTERPHVYLIIVVELTGDHFWCHPADRTHLAHPVPLVLCELSCIAKVCKLDRAVRRHQNIVRLNIAMQNVSVMQILQAL